MPLADRYTLPDTRSKFEKWVETLREDHKAVVIGWLNDPNISNIKLAQMVRDDDPEDGFTGYRSNKDAVADWRRKNVSR